MENAAHWLDQKNELSGKSRFIRLIGLLEKRYIAGVANFCKQRGWVNGTVSRPEVRHMDRIRDCYKSLIVTDDLSDVGGVEVNRIES